jgi:hypothetical protein
VDFDYDFNGQGLLTGSCRLAARIFVDEGFVSGGAAVAERGVQPTGVVPAAMYPGPSNLSSTRLIVRP